jgi:serine/threonine protein phosphatase PrpC
VQAVVAALPASPESQFASLESRESACRSAVEAARREVTALGDASDGSSPACTLVLGLVHERSVTVASVGDSRAYWLGPDSHQLTIDDSVAQMRISAGLSEKEALASPDGHTITNWIGEDAPSDPPQIASFDAATPGHLLLCTDGLWNYFPAPIELFEIIDQVSTASVVAGALKLVEAALEAGGHDNVGVALVAVTTDGPRSPTREITTEIPTETTTETTTETVTELVTR